MLGATSGLSFGIFEGVVAKSENRGKFEVKCSSQTQRWFATSGDSGAIYYFFRDEGLVPFAIHRSHGTNDDFNS
jgi:hypothetical protein